jgi:hypothetical protein
MKWLTSRRSLRMRSGRRAALSRPQVRSAVSTKVKAAVKLILVGATPASAATCSASKRTRLYASARPHSSWATPRGLFAARRLFAIEHDALDLVVAELDLPALVIERDDPGGGVSFGVDERGEQRLRL